jgi:hypothetical protein
MKLKLEMFHAFVSLGRKAIVLHSNHPRPVRADCDPSSSMTKMPRHQLLFQFVGTIGTVIGILRIGPLLSTDVSVALEDVWTSLIGI